MNREQETGTENRNKEQEVVIISLPCPLAGQSSISSDAAEIGWLHAA